LRHGALIVTEASERQEVISHLQASQVRWSLVKSGSLEIDGGGLGLDLLEFLQFAAHRGGSRKLLMDLSFHSLLHVFDLHIFGIDSLSLESSRGSEKGGEEGGLEDHSWRGTDDGCDARKPQRILKGHEIWIQHSNFVPGAITSFSWCPSSEEGFTTS
jgi:hypothetical protein